MFSRRKLDSLGCGLRHFHYYFRLLNIAEPVSALPTDREVTSKFVNKKQIVAEMASVIAE